MNPRPIVNPQLGELLRRARAAKGLSRRALGELSGVEHTSLAFMENGQIASPDPLKLRAIARALELDPSDLFALSGYAVPERLPSFAPYLRTKFEMPDAAVKELEQYFEEIRDRYGLEGGGDATHR